MTMESTLGVGHAAKLLGITVRTLQRWEHKGRLLPAPRTASKRRRYIESQLRAFLILPSQSAPRRIVACCRVSSAAQRPDLVSQRHALEQFTVARGLAGVEYIEEVGSGLNFKRKHFPALMDAIARDAGE